MTKYNYAVKSNPKDTVYQGTRDSSGRPLVTADMKPMSAEASQRIRNHSPDGPEWGYAGSGPAQLALMLLLHATRGNRLTAEDLYQRFKRRFVACWSLSGWTITRGEILHWIASQITDPFVAGCDGNGGDV